MSNFKVIVIGAGPTGLTAAHALSKAGIEFVVLERRRQVVEDVGASLVLFPHGIRVLAQFGLLDALRKAGQEVLNWTDHTALGMYMESHHMNIIRKNHGCYSLMFHRAELLQTIYEGLSKEDQSRVHTGKKLAGIDDTVDGVTVRCEDGSTYEGSIVLGADGVHSQTRQLMRELALRSSRDADVNEVEPFQYQYKTMWCSFPRRWEFAPGDHCITHGSGSSLQLLNSPTRSWIFVYEKLPARTTERVFLTEEDMEAFAAKHAEMNVGDRLKLRDVFPHRTSGGMANLEEGILRRWSGGRIVLAGDACHKFTPNAGLGFNNGIQDVVALVNELRRSLGPTLSPGEKGTPPPSRDELTAMSGRYQESRREQVLEDYKLSAHITRLSAWPNTTYWLVDQYVLPLIPRVNNLFARYHAAPAIRNGLCLDFLESDEPFEGEIPWLHPMKKKATPS